MVEINYEELKKLSREELTKTLDEKIESYKEDLAGRINTYEQAQEEEKKIVEFIDGFNEYLKGVRYVFGAGVSVGNKNVPAKQVYKYIQAFINKMEVEFQYTRGLMEMYDFWGSEPKEITYHVLESTLRTLQTLRFKGYDEMSKINVINNFFAEVRGDSIKDTAFQLYWANIHNAIIDRSELLNPVKSSNEQAESIEGTFEG